MGGQVFEVPPSIYLNQAQGICQFGIFKNNLGGDSVNLFIIGEPLLKHLYTVYDFENSSIKLGVNTDSAESGVMIYPPGERPLVRTKEEKVQDEIKAQKLAEKEAYEALNAEWKWIQSFEWSLRRLDNKRSIEMHRESIQLRCIYLIAFINQ